MKRLLISVLFIFILTKCYSQNPFRIKIIDKETDENIKDVNTYVDEIPGSDKYSDANGLVYYNNFPKDRKVSINIKKKGYITQVIEVLASPLATSDNFRIVKFEKGIDLNKLIIWGKVEDFNGKNIKNETIALNYLGKSLTTITDNYGNYRFEIEKSLFKPIKSFYLEIEASNCEKNKSTEEYHGELTIQKNIVLKCNFDSFKNSYENNKMGDFSSVNLIGTWICQTIELGQSITIIYSLLPDGTCEYEYYVNGKNFKKSTPNLWKYIDNILIETPTKEPEICVGYIKWNNINDFTITIIDNGNKAYNGFKRTYIRY